VPPEKGVASVIRSSPLLKSWYSLSAFTLICARRDPINMRAMYIGFREAPDQKAVATPNSTQAGVKVKKFGRIGPIKALLIEKTP
ncbi:MAG: hypothetical protein NTV01_07595, partial [Bacteroidia bacterium]|nr:hypothetical protein [Bacteroidia bacterium]